MCLVFLPHVPFLSLSLTALSQSFAINAHLTREPLAPKLPAQTCRHTEPPRSVEFLLGPATRPQA
eukprot:7117978-Pyramimonas_sp.AAC.1